MTTQTVKKSSNGILVRMARQLVACHDWLSSPPRTERERIQPIIATLEKARREFYPF
jgi:hypothetical protein